MPWRERLAPALPLVALLLASLGWALSHQAGSDGIFDDCHRGGGYVVIVSLLGLAMTAAGGVIGASVWRGAAVTGRRLFGLTAMLVAVLAGFAIVLQIVAGLVLPPCAG